MERNVKFGGFFEGLVEKAIKIPFFSGSNCLLYPGFDSFFFIPMGNTEFLNFFHFFDFIRSCVQNYFFTPEIGIVKQLKNNEVWYIFMAFSKALKKSH